MSPDKMLALISFAFAMSITPGPSNFLLLASGANFGFVRSIPLILGISGGFLLMVMMVGLGLGQLLGVYPLIYDLLRLACGIYVLWLSIQIAASRSLGECGDDSVATPIGFLQATLLQWLNPKAWTVALVVTATYLSADNLVSSLTTLILLFAVVNLPAISTWALSGAALRRFLSRGRRIAIFNTLMALLLSGSMLPMLLSV